MHFGFWMSTQRSKFIVISKLSRKPQANSDLSIELSAVLTGTQLHLEMAPAEVHSAMQCGGPCLPLKQRVIPPACPLLTPFALGEFDLDLRMIYAPLTRCRALGELDVLQGPSVVATCHPCLA